MMNVFFVREKDIDFNRVLIEFWIQVDNIIFDENCDLISISIAHNVEVLDEKKSVKE